MKILIAYEHYPISIGRYWKRGLIAAGHSVTSAGHCTGDRQAWPGEPRFLGREDVPDIPFPNFSNLWMISDELVERMRSGEWDVLISVDAAHHICGYPLPIPKIIVATDAHYISYNHQRKCCDLFINMHRAYSEESDEWIPYAFDPEWHSYDPTQPQFHDITFLGVPYELRVRELGALSSICKVYQGCGEAFEDFGKRYSQGWGSYARSSLRDLAARFWEGLATRTVTFINRVPDLKLLEHFSPPALDGIHYIGYSSLPELLDRVKWCMENVEAREAIRDAGHKWVQPHSWERRAEQLVELIHERLGVPV